MRSLASHVAVFMIAVILATAAGAVAQPPRQPSLMSRVKRLEVRHDILQSRYQTFCNTLKYTEMGEIQDVQVRELFLRLANTCWSP
jgi:hypothetical protein